MSNSNSNSNSSSSSSKKLYNESLKIDSTKLSEPFRSTFIPSIIKSGFSVNDASALLEASIRYGATQLIINTPAGLNENDIKIRPLEKIDFKIDEDFNLIEFCFKDKVVMILGVEDLTKKQEPYPVKRVGIERARVKVIDIVDVEDLYHTNHISFLTPIMYRVGDMCNITFDRNKPIPDTLKILGLVFFK